MKNRFTITGREAGQTLQEILVARTGLSRNRAKALCDQHMVSVNGQPVWMARHKLALRDEVSILGDGPGMTLADRNPAAPKPHKIHILFEDPDFLVIDKPHGLLSVDEGSVESILRKQLQSDALRAAHRLDRETSGCLMMARNQGAFDAAVTLFRNRRITKVYHALALGRVPADIKEIRKAIDGQEAISKIQVLDANATASHLKISIETGRTHQIRIHLQAAGHPLIGDKQYRHRSELAKRLSEVPRQMLHAYRLIFEHPYSRQLLRITAPLPADFTAWRRALRLT